MTVGLAINVMWAVTLWSLAAAGLVYALRKRRAAIRRDLCRLALLGVPVVMAGVAAMHVWRPSEGLVDWRVDVAVSQPQRHVAAAISQSAGPASSVRAVGSSVATEGAVATSAVDEVLTGPVAEPLAAMAPVESEARAGAARAAPVTSEPARPIDWAGLIALVAASSTAVLLAMLIRRIVLLALWRRSWRAAPRSLVSVTDRLAGRMGLRPRFEVFVVPGLHQPAAAGVFRPAVLLPDRAQTTITPALRGALLHELGHVAGADTVWGLIGLGVAAVAWWCPAVWLLRRRAQVEAEMTADDCALESGTRPGDLARAMLEFAERVQAPMPVSVPAMGCHLRRRVETMIDANRSHSTKVGRCLRWLLAVGASVAVVALVTTPLVGVAAVPEQLAQAAEEEPVAPDRAEPPAPAESSVAVAIVRNKAQMEAARAEREKVKDKLYAVRRKFDRQAAVAELRRAASEAEETYDNAKLSDPNVAKAREAERVLDEALDALVEAKLKTNPDAMALRQKAADLEEERASLSMVYAIAELKLTHRDSPVYRALSKDAELAKLYRVYKESPTGPVRDKHRSAYYAARKVALAKLPAAVALMEEMAAAKKGMDAAYKAHYAAEKKLRDLVSRIKYDRKDTAIAEAYAKRSAARKARYEIYESSETINAARAVRDKTRKAYYAKLKELMAADADATALESQYKALDKELDELEDEARELRKKKAALDKAGKDVGAARRPIRAPAA